MQAAAAVQHFFNPPRPAGSYLSSLFCSAAGPLVVGKGRGGSRDVLPLKPLLFLLSDGEQSHKLHSSNINSLIPTPMDAPLKGMPGAAPPPRMPLGLREESNNSQDHFSTGQMSICG